MTDALPVVDDPEGLAALIREVSDFPSPGIAYKDITPLLAHGRGLSRVVDGLTDRVEREGMVPDVVVGIESRGFIIGAPLALRLGCGFIPVRKPGKLPFDVVAEEYALEYGTDRLEVHVDGIVAGHRALIVDDVIATGGTAAATARLVIGLGGQVAGFAFLLELSGLGGRALIDGHPIVSLISY